MHTFFENCPVRGPISYPFTPPLCAFLKLTKALFGSTAAVKFISPHNYTIKKERREKKRREETLNTKKNLFKVRIGHSLVRF
jgi:hypothetical protein